MKPSGAETMCWTEIEQVCSLPDAWATSKVEEEGAGMAVKFLSEEWARAVTEALNSSEEFQQAAANQQVKLQQIVTDPPEGAGKYYFSLQDGKAEIDLGEVTDPEATLSQDYETAVAISRRELNPQNAFMQGKLKIQGNMMKLLQLQGVLNAMPKALSETEVEY
jgi:putative sterol carrier protein